MDVAQPYNTYSAIKINDLSSQKNTRRKLKCILVSERSPSKRATDYLIPSICHLERAKLWRQYKDHWFAKGLARCADVTAQEKKKSH